MSVSMPVLTKKKEKKLEQEICINIFDFIPFTLASFTSESYLIALKVPAYVYKRRNFRIVLSLTSVAFSFAAYLPRL